ncbi:MAG: motility and Chemotaxis [Hyphomicrobiales bacterium]|nr:motility and Chemotaxis [Hyphomicrobiales bacterium]
MASAIGFFCRAFAYGAIVLSGSVITLSGGNVPKAATHASLTDATTSAPPRPFGLDELELRISGEPGANVGVEVAARTSPFGALDAEAFATQAHGGVLRYGDVAITLPFDAETDTYSFGPMRLKHQLVETILRASYLAGVDPRLLMAIADKESSFVASARAPTSSATGLFQFIDATWLKAVRDFGPQFGLSVEAAVVAGSEAQPTVGDEAERARILSMRRDPFLATLFAAAMLRREQEKLSVRMGRTITEAEVYLVHFLGPAGAEKFLAALAETPALAAANLLPAAARANKPIFFTHKTVFMRAKRRKAKAVSIAKVVPVSLSVAEVHGKIGDSLERRLVRYRTLDFGGASSGAGDRQDL